MILSCFSDEIAPALSDQIRVIKELGLGHLEIRTVNDVSVMDMTDGELSSIRRTLDGNGLTVTAVSSPVGKDPADEPTELTLEKTRRALAIAGILGCRFVRVFSFYQKELPFEEAYEKSLEKLTLMAREAEKAGITLVVESGVGTVGARSANMKKLLEDVNSPALRCAFDMAAFFAAGDEPFEESLPAMDKFIAYVHIKDAKRGENGRVPAGEGDARVRDVVRALKSRELVFSLEPHLAYAGAKRGFSGEENFRKAHKALIEILKEENIPYA